MEDKYAPSVYQALQSQVRAFIDNLNYGGLNYAKGKLSTDILNERIAPLIQKIYTDSAISNANQIYSLLKRYEGQKYRGFGFNEKWTADVLEYFRLHLLEKAVLPISEHTKEIILRTLEKATNEGWSTEETVKEITQKTTEINRMRARRIVRTETVRGVNFGGMLAAWESPFEMEKAWVSAHDNRVRGSKPKDRHSHLALDKVKVDLLEPFYEPRSGERIYFPGDPESSAGNTINCRCNMTYRPKRDANGRLTRKPTQESGISFRLIDALSGALLGLNIRMNLFNDN